MNYLNQDREEKKLKNRETTQFHYFMLLLYNDESVTPENQKHGFTDKSSFQSWINKVCNQMENKNKIESCFWALHDKDKYTDNAPDHKVGDTKKAHYHVVIKFKSNNKQTLKAVSKMFNLPENFINYSKNDIKDLGHVTRYEGFVQYLGHTMFDQNDPEHAKYEIGKNVFGVPCNPEINETKLLTEIFAKRPDQVKASEYDANNFFDDLKIIRKEIEANFEIFENYIIDYSKLNESRPNYKSVIKRLTELDARFTDYYALHDETIRKQIKAMITQSTELLNCRNREVFWIYGESDGGKSTLAQKLCEANNLKYYLATTGGNPFDKYDNQEVVILNEFDMQDNVESYNYWKTLLDNYNGTPEANARYNNKNICCAKIFILTSTQSPTEYINRYYTRNNIKEEVEPKKQFLRRISKVFKITETEKSPYFLKIRYKVGELKQTEYGGFFEVFKDEIKEKRQITVAQGTTFKD